VEDVTSRPVRASRKTEVDELLLAAALLRLQHDQTGRSGRWSLGGHGALEIDTWFTPAEGGKHLAAGWLLGPEGDVVRIEIVASESGDHSGLALRTHAPLPERWVQQPAVLRTLARVALAELAEELRWQASRAVPATTPATA